MAKVLFLPFPEHLIDFPPDFQISLPQVHEKKICGDTI
jgi:hypothetical protein